MNSVSDFFGKFKNFAFSEIKKREEILTIIHSEIGHKLDIGDISIKDGIVVIKGNSSLKSEIYLKKNRILKKVSEQLKNIKINDIR